MSYEVKPKLAVASGLPPIQNGSLVATTDTGDMYVDAGGNRVKLSDVIADTYANIMSLVTPLTNKIYYATDTHQLFQATYRGRGNTLTWYELTGYTLPTASQSTLGGVKVDGTTITISNGVITANIQQNSGTGGTKWDGNAIIPSQNLAEVAGNSRGYGSVDLQTWRDSATQVVTGGQSFAVGANNTVVGGISAALGSNNTVRERNSAVLGKDNIAEGEKTFILGSNITQTTEGEPRNGAYFGQGYTIDLGDTIAHNVIRGSIDNEIESPLETSEFGHTGTKGILILEPRQNFDYKILKVGRLSAAIIDVHIISQSDYNAQLYHYGTNHYTIYKTGSGTDYTNTDWFKVIDEENRQITHDSGFWYDQDDYTVKYKCDANDVRIQFGIRYTILGKGHMNRNEDPYYQENSGSGYGYYGYYGYGYGS